jgi:hypothetical protein
LEGEIVYTGEAEDDFSGVGLSAGDINADGYDDILVGSANESTAIYVVLGSAGPTGGSLSTTLQYAREYVNDGAGGSVSGSGDVDGDGYSDVLVGAMDFGGDSGGDVGGAYLLMGSALPSSGSLSSAVRYSGELRSDYAGSGVAIGGDLDGDGHDDLVVGAAGAAGSAGEVFLLLGSGL